MKLTVANGVIALILAGVPSICGQDLGAIARQDRARRSHLSSHPPVLTNEDLSRDRILSPELKNRILGASSGDLIPPAPDIGVWTNIATASSRMAADIVPDIRAADAPARAVPVDPVVAVEQTTALRNTYQDTRKRLGEYEPSAPVRESAPAAVPPADAVFVATAPQAGDPVSFGEYARQLQAERTARLAPEAVGIQAPAAGAIDESASIARQLRAARASVPEMIAVQPPAIAAADETPSLGEYARQLRAARASVPGIIAVQPPAIAAADETPSLGEFARQLRAARASVPEIIAVQPPAAAVADETPSLGEYARQLRSVRSLEASEYARMTPVPPPITAGEVTSGVSLGEYARQVRIRHAAEEYSRLLSKAEVDLPATGSLRTSELTPEMANLAIPRDAVLQPAARVERVAPAPRSVRIPRVVSAGAAAGVLAGSIAVTVRRGDSLWRLARTYLGSGSRWKMLAFLLQHQGSPDRIFAGEVVLLPARDGQNPTSTASNQRKPLP